MNKQVIICHAYNTLPTENWYIWLKNNLGEKGFDVKVVEFPKPEAPTESEWVQAIKDVHTNDQAIFIGHSLGCRAILAYINQYNISAERVILVACPMFWEGITETRPPLKAYVEDMQKLDFKKLKKLVPQFDIFHDTTDHIVSMKSPELLKEKLGENATLHISNKYDHFDVPAVPELLNLISTSQK